MNRPRILITAYGDAIITFPYHPGLVDILKQEIPSYARSYDPSTKAWTVYQPYIARAGALVEQVFPDTEVVDHSVNFHDPRREGDHDSGPRDAYVILHLQPTAPAQLVEAAYKCLSRIHHPDRGGDTDAMQAINAAVDSIRKARKA